MRRPQKKRSRAPGARRSVGHVSRPAPLSGCRIAAVVSRFNGDITGRLFSGAARVIRAAGQLERFDVPGAFEIPGVLRRLIRTGRYDGLVAIGCVIRGETDHFRIVADQVREGVGRLSSLADIPVTFGVLTVFDRAQAKARAGGRLGNVGADAARALLDMIRLSRRIDGMETQGATR